MFCDLSSTKGIDMMNEKEYLEKAHEIMLKLLIEFDRVCQKYSIKYYVICGSLLGAIRHREFIPWDDDVDVAVPRKDFDKLIKIASAEWGQGSYCLVNYDDLGKHTFLDFMTRLVYMDEEIPINIYNKIKGKGRDDIENRLPLDIYVLDNAANNERKHKILTSAIQGLYGLAMGHRAYLDYTEYTAKDKSIQTKVKLLSTIGKFIPLKFIFFMYEFLRKLNRDNNCDDYYESNGWIFCIPWRFPQNWFGEGTKIEISDHYFVGPEMYEMFLKKHYGNYMKLPSEDKRKPTHSQNASGIY